MASEIEKDWLASFIIRAGSKDPDARRAAALMDITADEVAEVAKHVNPQVRQLAVGKLNTPVDVLRHCANDEDWTVRSEVMRNPNTPVDVLRDGAKDEHEGVRMSVMKNPNTPDEILRQAFTDKNKWVRLIADDYLYNRWSRKEQ